ncbi:hypothetical protein DM860_012812 [Cuscuta australis]|uniref:PX domain-containing protein n=1 Tax=Cuscuta australis TaxID=267555 RepID=A0A328DYE1_9ASTE|nr:hypothetical protein DM860_012812 [Cuscuta australis]
MKPMETLQDLIEEAKLRAVWWALCIFSVCYFLTHTSKSMWMNLPVAILLVCGLRMLLKEVEFSWRIQNVRPKTYLSHLGKKQLCIDDSRLPTSPPLPNWKSKIDSLLVESAMEDFIQKLLRDFVTDLWYSVITPDQEAPELIHAIVMEALGEISHRVKQINLVDLLTRDVVDLIGDHLDLYRRNQASIGVDVMATLSSEERDERLKHHLLTSQELHPALISPECEYKVLQRLMRGVLTVVLQPSEAQCPLALCIARELLTCLVMQPILNFASPGYINELIEYILLAINDKGVTGTCNTQSSNSESHNHDLMGPSKTMHSKSSLSSNKADDHHQQLLSSSEGLESNSSNIITQKDERTPLQPADWARVLEAATQRRKEVLMPENLENMWAIGRNYKKKLQKKDLQVHVRQSLPRRHPNFKPPTDQSNTFATLISHESRGTTKLKRSNSTSDLSSQPNMEGPVISDFYTPESRGNVEVHSTEWASSEMVLQSDVHQVPKLKCRVVGAYFEKMGSKSFAVYSIAVTNSNNTWFVKRRYSNFERLHRHLKDIPNYTLHLPPKRIFSSNMEDAFVHQRCLQLDKYLQDLLSIANVAEQLEVWDFLSDSSKNYSFGKSSSVMRSLAVNVDDAMDDIVRQFKGVSDGLVRKVSSTPSSYEPVAASLSGSSQRETPWSGDEVGKLALTQSTSESANSYNSDDDIGTKIGTESSPLVNGWHSDNELNSKEFPPRVVKHDEKFIGSFSPEACSAIVPSQPLDPSRVPPEWTPPNLSVPVLNLVDNIFQLKRRGWLRRQVFWISKQILQLMMEDAIDEWLLRQIHWLRREDVIAHGIQWVQNILWPDGTFFLKLNAQSEMNTGQPNQEVESGIRVAFKEGSFEEQLEAVRRASEVKKMLFDGAPATLVGLIGHKQYRRCARDIYYFLQSTVCLKQLAFGILELLLVTIFPELHDTVREIRAQSP